MSQRTNIERAIKAAAKAGASRVEVKPDGTVSVEFAPLETVRDLIPGRDHVPTPFVGWPHHLGPWWGTVPPHTSTVSWTLDL